MVQGGLLTAHPGGVHGDGGSPGGGSSFRQGAEATSPGSPDLETAATAVQRSTWHPQGMGLGNVFPNPYPPYNFLPIPLPLPVPRVLNCSIPKPSRVRVIPAGKNTHLNDLIQFPFHNIYLSILSHI